MAEVEGPSEAVPPETEEEVVICGGYVVKILAVYKFFEEQVTFTTNLILDAESSGLSDELIQTLMTMGNLFVTSVTKIGAIVAQRSSSNAALTKPLPPVLPHHLVKLNRAKDFYDVVEEYRNRLEATKGRRRLVYIPNAATSREKDDNAQRTPGSIIIDRIEAEYQSLRAYETKKEIRLAFNCLLMPRKRGSNNYRPQKQQQVGEART
ncbi:hypothetical protein PsorP6_002323 [Peronosclerospora sorghi]|uniref:Uncharacterized protein n=1 Tax=Peronosclerospora sorghi TaxID=230839 RepID=A0ACC0WU71_9STRA|nr:hypothetical protein PsorP6_002323 [Peronosclerospora sorghi]